MENQFKVINRTTREEQVFNSEEINKFFYCVYDKQTDKIKYNNNIRDYAISHYKSDSNSEIWKFIDSVFFAVCSLFIIVCITKIVLLWN